jgi:hypothetical protein
VISERATGYGHFGNEGNLKATVSLRHWLTASQTTTRTALRFVPFLVATLVITSTSTRELLYGLSIFGRVTNGHFSISPRPALGPTQPPHPISNGYRGLFPWGVKRQGREADHSSSTSAETKTTWIYTSTLQYTFMEQGQLDLTLHISRLHLG